MRFDVVCAIRAIVGVADFRCFISLAAFCIHSNGSYHVFYSLVRVVLVLNKFELLSLFGSSCGGYFLRIGVRLSMSIATLQNPISFNVFALS